MVMACWVTGFNVSQTATLIRMLLPAGLINTHHHMFQALTRCIAQDQKLFGWLKAMYAGWEHIKVRLHNANGCTSGEA